MFTYKVILVNRKWTQNPKCQMFMDRVNTTPIIKRLYSSYVKLKGRFHTREGQKKEVPIRYSKQ